MRETGYLGAISRSLDIAGYQKQLIGTEGAPAAYLFMLFFNLIPLYMDSSAKFLRQTRSSSTSTSTV